jgi:ABC-2 type transport system ATP-binding protein
MLVSLPFVRSVQREGTIFHITLAGEDSIKPLMDSLVGTDIRRVCLKEPTLEDVFIALTGEKVRE